MPTPADLTTKLKAVNAILARMGETPVESLDAVESSLTEKAVNALDEASRMIQSTGFYWNTEPDWHLLPDVDGFLQLPANTLRVARAQCSTNDTLVQRGQRLYNSTKHSFEFEAGRVVHTDLVVFLDWDDLPEFAKQPIYRFAAKVFQLDELTSTTINAELKEDLDAAVALLAHAEDEQGPANIFRDSPQGAQLWGDGTRRR